MAFSFQRRMSYLAAEQRGIKLFFTRRVIIRENLSIEIHRDADGFV